MAIETNKVVYPQGPIFNKGVVLTDGTETTLYTAGTDGARIDAFSITTSDTTDGTIAINIYNDAGSPALIYKEVIPLDDLCGYGPTYTTQKPACDVLQNFLKCAAPDGSGVRHLYVQAGYTIKVAYLGTLSSESCWVFCQGWEF